MISRDSFLQPHSCDPSPVLYSVAFQTSLVSRLLLNLNPYGENDPDELFSLFYKQVAQELAPKLAVIFRHLVKGGNFPAGRMLADVAPVPRKSPSSNIGDLSQLLPL